MPEPATQPINTNDLPDNLPIITLLDNLTPHHKKIDLPKAYELRQQGLSYKDIGTFFKCSKQAVHQILEPYIDRTQQVTNYKDNRADILADIQLQLLTNIDTARLEKAPLGALTLSYAQLYDKEALERGNATEIVRYDAASLRDRYAELKDMLQKTSVTINPNYPGSDHKPKEIPHDTPHEPDSTAEGTPEGSDDAA